MEWQDAYKINSHSSSNVFRKEKEKVDGAPCMLELSASDYDVESESSSLE